MKLHIAA